MITIENIVSKLSANDGALAGVERIAEERELVNSLLAQSNSPKVYGFNSLLGHMDHLGMKEGDEQRLLNAHLVGPEYSIPSDWLKLLMMTKSTQLLNGHSGVSPEALRLLLDLQKVESHDNNVHGNWFSSYGSGDVVQGAWFVNAVKDCFDVNGLLSQPGDLIALISGNFVSTSAAIVCLDRLVVSRSRLNNVFGLVTDYLPLRDSGVQKSVTVRDLGQVQDQLDVTINALGDEIVASLSRSSANPMFSFDDNEVCVSSNSSFLGFGLRMALVRALHTVSLAHAYLLGCTRMIADRQTGGASLAVQPPKIMSANGKSIASIVSSVGSDYSLVESGGVEDVGDLSLLGAGQLIRAESVLTRSLSVFRQMIASIDDNMSSCDFAVDSPLGERLGIDFNELSNAMVTNSMG